LIGRLLPGRLSLIGRASLIATGCDDQNNDDE
jgi:hypothetical protein